MIQSNLQFLDVVKPRPRFPTSDYDDRPRPKKDTPKQNRP